ncbi:MAG: hypothetical protein NTZ33_15685 [Bacteroidetes bacterium]|nr:hypothetical protein [Bacteroidota bacterium]
MLRIKKIPASTLPETIISLIILLSCFSIAVMLISSLYKETISEKECFLHFKLQEFKSKTLNEHRYFDESVQYRDFLLVKRVSPSKYCSDLIYIKFYTLNDKQDTLLKQELYVYIPEGLINK